MPTTRSSLRRSARRTPTGCFARTNQQVPRRFQSVALSSAVRSGLAARDRRRKCPRKATAAGRRSAAEPPASRRREEQGVGLGFPILAHRGQRDTAQRRRKSPRWLAPAVTAVLRSVRSIGSTPTNATPARYEKGNGQPLRDTRRPELAHERHISSRQPRSKNIDLLGAHLDRARRVGFAGIRWPAQYFRGIFDVDWRDAFKTPEEGVTSAAVLEARIWPTAASLGSSAPIIKRCRPFPVFA